MVPVPLTTVHKPIPTTGALPAKVAVVPHIDWGGPATEGVTVGETIIVSLLVVGRQGGLAIVHIKTFIPVPNPVTDDVGEAGVVIVPVPLTNVQVPVPTVGVLPESVEVFRHVVWLGPATATVAPPVGGLITVV